MWTARSLGRDMILKGSVLSGPLCRADFRGEMANHHGCKRHTEKPHGRLQETCVVNHTANFIKLTPTFARVQPSRCSVLLCVPPLQLVQIHNSVIYWKLSSDKATAAAFSPQRPQKRTPAPHELAVTDAVFPERFYTPSAFREEKTVIVYVSYFARRIMHTYGNNRVYIAARS